MRMFQMKQTLKLTQRLLAFSSTTRISFQKNITGDDMQKGNNCKADQLRVLQEAYLHLFTPLLHILNPDF